MKCELWMKYVKCNEVWNVNYEWWNMLYVKCNEVWNVNMNDEICEMWNVVKFEMWIMNDEICCMWNVMKFEMWIMNDEICEM